MTPAPTAAQAAPTPVIEHVTPAPVRLSPSTVSNSGIEGNDVNDESDSGYESNRSDEANEYNDESDGGDEAKIDDLQWSTRSVGANCENLLDRVYNEVRNGQSPYELHRDG